MMIKNQDWTRSEDDALSNGRATAPFVATERGFIDEVIEPAQTRPKLIRALALLENKRDQNPPKKHGNIPLSTRMFISKFELRNYKSFCETGVLKLEKGFNIVTGQNTV